MEKQEEKLVERDPEEVAVVVVAEAGEIVDWMDMMRMAMMTKVTW